MRSYQVLIGEREYQVKLHKGKLTVDGEPVDVRLTALNGSGMHLLRRNRRALELHFSYQDARTYQVMVEGHVLEAEVRHAGRGSNKPRSRAAEEGALIAPMPGIVVDVHVDEGEQVEKGQILVVVESMKMQMQMRAAVDGTAARVAVKPGQQVEKGLLLVLVQAETPE